MLLTLLGLVLSPSIADRTAPLTWAAFLTVLPAVRFFPFTNSQRTDSGIYLRKISITSIKHLSLVSNEHRPRRGWNRVAELPEPRPQLSAQEGIELAVANS
jgi:hypothetical protein